MTEVVNLKKDKYDVYIGRGSPFGNPFKIGKTYGICYRSITREQAIELYKPWFYMNIQGKPGFKEAVLKLKDKKLGCYCKPLACHGDIIKLYLDSVNTFWDS